MVAQNSNKDETASPGCFKQILVAVDGSECSRRAAEKAIQMAKHDRARLDIVSIISFPHYPYSGPIGEGPPGNYYDDYMRTLHKQADGHVQRVLSMARTSGLEARGEVQEIPGGSVVEAIVNYAAGEKADLIVMGTRGLGGFKKLLLGSVSSGVITNAQCPVLVVR